MSDVPRCCALGCQKAIGPAMAFCAEHWKALPRNLQDGVYASMRKPDKYAGAKAAAISWLTSLQSKTRIS